MIVECVDSSFSTTRRVTRTVPEATRFLNGADEWTRSLSSGLGPRGGLRTRGLFKLEGDEPLITVVTVTFNPGPRFEQTILSILNQSYSNIEYIIVDGGSTDGTLETIKKYDHAIDYWVSEPDGGLYDAMNKAIRWSSGSWLNFLNAKDTFYDDKSIEAVVNGPLCGEAKFVYSDVLLMRGDLPNNEGTLHRCDHLRLIINHQAAIYQKSLHLVHGLYLVAPKLTISDYLFFSLINPSHYVKAAIPIAKYDTTGISQSQRSSDQKFVIDYLVNGMSKYKFGIYFYLYHHFSRLKAASKKLLRVTRPD